MQINLTGFLQQKNARIFMKDLWALLVSAQAKCGAVLFLSAAKHTVTPPTR